MKISQQDIINAIDQMKLVEVKELVTMIEEHFGVKASVGAGSVAPGAKNAEPSVLNVVLQEIGSSKIAVIKLVAKVTGKGLMDAKKMLDTLPATIKEQMKPEAAEELINEFKTVGAVAVGK